MKILVRAREGEPPAPFVRRSGRKAISCVTLLCSLLTVTTYGGTALAERSRSATERSSLLRPTAMKKVEAATNAAERRAPRRARLRWLASHLPVGGVIGEGGAVLHKVQPNESWRSIAESYLELTDVYDVSELARLLEESHAPLSRPRRGPTPGLRIRVPRILEAPPKKGANERLGLPKDGILKGIYVRGTTAGAKSFPAVLDRVAEHGMNAIVLDVKDYDGPLTYPSKVPLAIESGAAQNPPMRSYARAVRFAHQRGIRVIARVSCFNDAWMAKARPSMAIRGVSGYPYRNGWLDPQNEDAQKYVLDLVKEALDAGADEIQLDYVRYPVLRTKYIDFRLDPRNPNAKVEVITRFVERVHALTRAHGVPLSIDVFGVIAFGKKVDIQNLGQDPVELAQHSEFLSAMVYPSHYEPGFMGFDEPGDHPELVGIGVKHLRAHMAERGLDLDKVAQIRPWLQAMRHRSSNYGTRYVQDEIRSGDNAGGKGWLLWNPGQVYDIAWRGVAAARTSPSKAHLKPDDAAPARPASGKKAPTDGSTTFDEPSTRRASPRRRALIPVSSSRD